MQRCSIFFWIIVLATGALTLSYLQWALYLKGQIRVNAGNEIRNVSTSQQRIYRQINSTVPRVSPIVRRLIPYCYNTLTHRVHSKSRGRVINSLEFVPKNTTEVVFHKVYESDSIVSQGIVIPIASHATHIKLTPGIVYYHPDHVILDRHWNIYKFNHENVESSLPSYRLNCSAVHYHRGKLMVFIRPWSYVFSHVVATVLPALNFTCQYLEDNSDISILVVSQLQQELMCEVCSAACNISRILNYQSVVGWRMPIIADVLYYPFFWHPTDEWPLGMYPAHTLRTLSSLRKDITLPDLIRSDPIPLSSHLTYMPRPNTSSRSVRQEMDLLRAICRSLSHESRLQLKIFKSSLSYKLDMPHFATTSIMLSPHSGAMANMIFLPPSSSVVEFVDLSKGNPYYVGLCRVLGLKHLSIKPLLFDHYNASIPLVVDTQEVLNTLHQLEPLKSHPLSTTNISEKDKEHIKNCLDIVDNELDA